MVDLRQHFPHELRPRPQQVEAMEWLESEWKSKDVFILDAPTGVGKSAVAAAAMGAAGRAYLLTSSKALQDQYLAEQPALRSIKGQGNYRCNINPHFMVNYAPCVASGLLKESCMRTSACSYYRERDAALSSKFMLTSYQYFLMAVECGPLSEHEERGELRRSLVVCDEAHELDPILSDFMTFEVDREQLMKDHDVEAPPASTFTEAPSSAVAALKSAIDARLAKYSQDLERLLGTAEEISRNTRSIPKAAALQAASIIKLRDPLDRLAKKMSRMTGEWKSSRLAAEKFVFFPIDSKQGFKEYLAPLGAKFLLMSASIGDSSALCRELGLDPSRVTSLRTSSPFNPAASPVYFAPMLKLNRDSIDASISTAVDAVDEILDSHQTEKGIVHTGNYKLSAAVLSSSRHRARLIGKGSGAGASNEEMLKRHAQDPRPTVLVSPSMHTGVDLRGDLSRFQVIVKLPWPSLADPRVKEKSADGSWYANEMVKKLVQASGRSTRDAGDSSVTYVLDDAVRWVWNKHRSLFPGWFVERVKFA